MNWQHLNILAATNYLRERIASGVPDSKAREVYDGLLDVLDPSRIERRANAAAAAPVRPEPDASQVLTKLDATSQVRLKPDATSPPAPAPARLKIPAKKAAPKKQKTSPPATPARRRPARPARPAKPRRR
jgi:hypothetical protein